MSYQALFICKGGNLYGSTTYTTIVECKENIVKMLEKHEDCHILKTLIIVRDGKKVSIREV